MRKKTGALVLIWFLILSLMIGCSGGSGDNSDPSPEIPPKTPPQVGIASVSALAITGATVEADVNPNGQATNAWFEYGADPVLNTYTTTQAMPIGATTTGQRTSAILEGLSTGNAYYVRAVAESANGITRGDIISFTPSSPPHVMTIQATDEKLFANVNPNGLPTSACFYWGIDPSLASFTQTATQPIVPGATEQYIEALLTGLTPGTTYYFRAFASNSLGSSLGASFISRPQGLQRSQLFPPPG